MLKEKVFSINLEEEIKKYFDDSSISADDLPEFVLLLGAVCTGKTTTRKNQYSKGYVLIDAAEIFLSLSNGEYYDFGTTFEEPLEIIGSLIARRAIEERRNIVTEIIGATQETPFSILDAMKSIGYKLNIVYNECEMGESWRRNVERGADNISAYYTEPYHKRWILGAILGENL